MKKVSDFSISDAANCFGIDGQIIASACDTTILFLLNDAGDNSNFWFGDAANCISESGSFGTAEEAIADRIDGGCDVIVFDDHQEMASYILENDLR